MHTVTLHSSLFTLQLNTKGIHIEPSLRRKQTNIPYLQWLYGLC